MSTCRGPHDLFLVKRGPNAFEVCVRCDHIEPAGSWAPRPEWPQVIPL